MKERIRQLMASALQVPISEIKESSSIHTLAAWDSLQHLRLVMALEQEFGVKFKDVEIPEVTSFVAIQNCIAQKLEKI